MAAILEIRGLTKRWGKFTAVDTMNLDIMEGEIFGFLGPNGAGKTTTISMLTTLIKPTSGMASIAGHSIQENPAGVRSVIGVVPQVFSLFPELTAEENLGYIGKLYGMEDRLIRDRTEILLKTVSLYEHRNRISGVFSGGMKQRLSLAAGIMSKPKLLFMDEPTTGLDPQSRIAIRELTKKLNSEGMTVLYTTHDMEEADKLCDRISIMDKGKIIAIGTSQEIKRQMGDEGQVEVELESIRDMHDAVRDLKKERYVDGVHASGRIITFTIKGKENVFYMISDFFRKRKINIREIRFKEYSLEEVFLHLTKKELRDE